MALPHELELVAQLRDIGDRFTWPALASSMSAEDMVLLHAIVVTRAPIDIFVIDTGRLHQETLSLIDTSRSRYSVDIEVLRPLPERVDAYVQRHGLNGFYEGVSQRHLCCDIRKVEPLTRALQGRDAWLTGQRRAHGPERAGLLVEEKDLDRGIAKFNPLAAWSDAMLWDFVQRHGVPVNALHARGYPSIGCEPCTRAVQPHEDARAGRWWWEQGNSKECGLHLPSIRVEHSYAHIGAETS